ncbi:hypothetical protein B0H16DRAFT_1469475 [Mycena metata]|uniref:Uncharacterized protein n=1 Tax=Mycena metata TaxID=1033252 RepID=A0AAD7HY04_9AGAR|nr:hypothetical protein B0H16DRAFT_1469475 [Mycena metata]
MGRLQFAVLIHQEEQSLDRETSSSKADPLRPLARKIAVQRREAALQTHVRAIVSRRAQFAVEVASRLPLFALSAVLPFSARNIHIDREDGYGVPSQVGFLPNPEGTGAFHPPSSTTTPLPLDVVRPRSAPQAISIFGPLEGWPPLGNVVRHDYAGNLIVRVLTIDSVVLRPGVAFRRHAIVEPGVDNVLQVDVRILLVGMVHHLVRVARNHGSSLDLPLCSVIECRTLSEPYPGSIIIVLAANRLVHPAFPVADPPVAAFKGLAPGSLVVETNHLRSLPVVPGPSIHRFYGRSVPEA